MFVNDSMQADDFLLVLRFPQTIKLTVTISIDKEYFHLNYFLTILAFTIYKSYYVSEQKTKTIDVYLLFKNEFQRKMKENKLLGINSLFNHILNKL